MLKDGVIFFENYAFENFLQNDPQFYESLKKPRNPLIFLFAIDFCFVFEGDM